MKQVHIFTLFRGTLLVFCMSLIVKIKLKKFKHWFQERASELEVLASREEQEISKLARSLPELSLCNAGVKLED